MPRLLIPVAPASAEERLLLSRPEVLAALVLPVARAARALPGMRLLVHTTLPAAAELLRPLADALLLEPDGEGGAESLAGHTRLALRAFLEQGVLEADAPVLVADFRNLRLGADTLGRAWAALETAPQACAASFAPVRDHPVQYRAPYRMRGIDLLVLPEAEPALLSGLSLGMPPGLGCTRPFFFDWRGLGLWEPGPGPRLCRLDARNSAGDLPPWQGGELPGDAAVFLPASPATARRLLPAGVGLAAVPAHAPTSPLPVTLTPRPNSDPNGGLDWTLAPAAGASGLLLLWPLAEGAAGGPGERIELAFGAARAGSLPGPAADAWLACLLEDAGEGAYDFFLPLDGRDLWRIDPATGRARHPVSGRFFNNRQEFPALHEQDLALRGGPAGRLAERLSARMAGVMAAEESWGVLTLAPGEAVKVCDRLGLALETGLRPELPPLPAPCPPPAPSDGPAYLDLPEFLPGQDQDAASLGRARAALSRLDWRQRQLQWLAERHPGPVQDDPVLHWALLPRANELAVSVRRSLCAAEIAARVREGLASPTRSPLAVPVPGPMPPGHPLGLASDGAQTAYLCLRGEDGRGRLWVKALAGGAPVAFGRPEADYLSLWRGGELLHAFHIREAGAPAAGVDSFDARLRLVASRRLPDALQGRPRLAKLCGEGERLFLLDFECRFLFELALPDLSLRDVHGFVGSDLAQACAAGGGRLLAASFYDSVLAVLDLRDGNLVRVQNPATLFAALVARDGRSGRIHVVSRADFPADYAPSPHWLHLLEPDGAPRASLDLGSVFASSLHVLEETGEALVFCREGLLLRCPGGR